VGIARVHEALGDAAKAAAQYKKVLTHDASNVEAIACMAANHFYSDQPELALRFYRRLLQVLLPLPSPPLPSPPLPSGVYAAPLRCSYPSPPPLARPRTPSHTLAHPRILTRACLRAWRLQMGVNNAELWCNVGLCCFYASQCDSALSPAAS